MPEGASVSQAEKGMEAGDTRADIPIGKKAPGWENLVREQGYDPAQGDIELEHDGQYHWRPLPEDPSERKKIEEQEVDVWP